jgi:hypothetical protein
LAVVGYQEKRHWNQLCGAWNGHKKYDAALSLQQTQRVIWTSMIWKWRESC